jgi:methylmalonyl-CoA mutase cobalamin-binding subunit
VSDINIWKTTNTADAEDEVATPVLVKGVAMSYTDGEELMAVHKLIELLDGLGSGEVLVVNRELF